MWVYNKTLNINFIVKINNAFLLMSYCYCCTVQVVTSVAVAQ